MEVLQEWEDGITPDPEATLDICRQVCNIIDGKEQTNVLQLMVGTVAQESNFKYIRQIGFGLVNAPDEPDESADTRGAFGICQVEVDSALDFYHNWHRMKETGSVWPAMAEIWQEAMIAESGASLTSTWRRLKLSLDYFVPDRAEMGYYLQHHHKLALAFCRLKYKRDSQAVPDDLQGIAEYWKRVYNTQFGAGHPEEFIENWHRFELDDLDWDG